MIDVINQRNWQAALAGGYPQAFNSPEYIAAKREVEEARKLLAIAEEKAEIARLKAQAAALREKAEALAAVQELEARNG